VLSNYICALDIGSSKIASAVASVKNRRLQNIFFDSLPLKSLKRGVIVDSIELVNAATKLMKNLKHKSGINIKFVYANISGQDIVTKHSHAVMPLAERGNKVITISDIQKVNEQARILGSSLEEEIVSLIPSSYSIDSKKNLINPIGLYSHRLEVDLYLVCGKLSFIQSLSRAISQSGYEVKGLFFSGLATSRAIWDKEVPQGVNIFCDIGQDITEILVFKDGAIKDIEILNLGGNDLTLQLQDELKIPFELAEDIKISHGIVVNDAVGIEEDKEILVRKNNFYKPIKQKLVSEIVTAKAKLLCAQIKASLEKKVSCYEVNSFVIAGRVVLLEGFIETLESVLCMPVKLARAANPDISSQKHLTYLTCLGMLYEALQDKIALPQIYAGGTAAGSPKNPIFKAFNRAKEIYQEYF